MFKFSVHHFLVSHLLFFGLPVQRHFPLCHSFSILMSYISLVESKRASSYLCFSAFENKVEAGHLSRSEKFSRKDLNYRVRALVWGQDLIWRSLVFFSSRSKAPPNVHFFSLRKYRSLASQLFVSLIDFYIKSYMFFTLPYQIISLCKCEFHCLAAVFGLMAIFLIASYGTCTNFSHIGFQYLLPLLPF